MTRDTDALLIVDAVSSLGIANLEMDAWGIDVVVAGSQKGLMLPPGLGLLRALRAGMGEDAHLRACRSTTSTSPPSARTRAGTRRTSRRP